MINNVGNVLGPHLGAPRPRATARSTRPVRPRRRTCGAGAAPPCSCAAATSTRSGASTSGSSCTPRTSTSPGGAPRRAGATATCPTSVVHHLHRASSGGERTPLPRPPEPAQPARGGDPPRRAARRRRSRGRARSAGSSSASAPTCCGRSCAARRPDVAPLRRRVRAAVDAARLLAGGAPAPAVGSARMRAVVTGGLGFVGRHLVRHLREAGDEVTTLDHHGDHAVDITDGPAVAAALAEVRARRRVPPGRLGRRRRVVAATRSRCSGSTPRARSTCCGPAPRPGVDRVLAVGQRRRLRRRHRGRAPAHRGLAPAPHQPLRRVARWPPTPSAQQAFLGHGLGVVRVRPFNHLGPGQSEQFVAPAIAARIARGRARRRRHRSPSATSPPAATSPTSATWCAPTASSSSGASRARSTTCAPASDLAVQTLADLLRRRWPAARSSSCPTRRCCARSTSRCSGATPPSCGRPPAGRPRSRSSRPGRPARRHARADRSSELIRRASARRQAGQRPGRRAARWRGVVHLAVRGRASRGGPAVERARGRRCARASSRSRSSRRHWSSTSVWRATTSGSRSALAIG